MKHDFLFVSLILILVISPASGQILNAGFENWTNGTPDDWMTNDVSGINPITPSANSHSGSFAVEGTVILNRNTMVDPVLLAGADGNGFPISTRPEALHGFYIFEPYPFSNDSLVIGISVSTQDTVIGTDTLYIGSSTDSYKEFVANVHYTANGTPDLINISVYIGRRNFGYIGTYFILDDLSFGSTVGVKELRPTLPSGFQLSQNYPEPFNPGTTISYQVPAQSYVTLKVFDLLGRETTTLVNGEQTAGSKSVIWNATNVPSGVYFYRLQTKEFTQTRKLLLLK